MEQNLKTKEGQDAWVKRAVSFGMDESVAWKTLRMMASAQESNTAATLNPSSLLTDLKSASMKERDLFSEVPSPIGKAAKANAKMRARLGGLTAKNAPADGNPTIKSDTRIDSASRERARQRLLSDKQLTFWFEDKRGVPNEIVRSALFSAKNRNVPRMNFKHELMAVIGDGELIYTGEELRQDDETVWLQLIHLARENGLATPFEFTPKKFCEEISWSVNGQSYTHLEECMTRLQATSLKITSKRLGNAVSLSMLPGFKAKRIKNGEGGLWTVRMHDELVFLFAEYQHTRVDWQCRITLSEGVATWLHAYYASHRVPYDVTIDTLARGAGLSTEIPNASQLADTVLKEKIKQRARDIKKMILKALNALKDVGFLSDFEVTRRGMVIVRRSSVENQKPIS
jgi:hypothetical protein